MLSHNGVTDGTKMTASERVGNMFMLLCAIQYNLANQAKILHAYSLHSFDNAFDETLFAD